MADVLVTGGTGYVGSVLVPRLLECGHKVTVLDSLLYETGHVVLGFLKRPRFTFVKGDVRDPAVLAPLVRAHDVIIHLAAIVGFPACEKNQDLALSTNLGATKLLSSLASREQLILYASTGSNYGQVEGVCTEETPLNPVSLYGRTKTDAEKWLLEHNTAIAYRFATAFGLSPRMRLDLLINDFVYQTVINQYLILFEKHFKRTFIHVDDMAASFLFAIDNAARMQGQVFNVGDDCNNFTKEDIASKIAKKVNFYLHFADIGEDKDKRNYEVSYAKINALGFRGEVTVDTGIDELIAAIPVLEHRSQYRNV
jgi:nucleoside-diphosphate-sugar epimerase